MSNENWLKEEINKAKSNTNDWPEWRKQSVTSSTAYSYSQACHSSSSTTKQNTSSQNNQKT